MFTPLTEALTLREMHVIVTFLRGALAWAQADGAMVKAEGDIEGTTYKWVVLNGDKGWQAFAYNGETGGAICKLGE